MADKQATSSTTPKLSENPELAKTHDMMLDGLGKLATYFGFSKVVGQLYGTLLMSATPLSLDDMMERLDISKAGVSMNMRTLEHMGMVRQVWVRGRGGRRKYYEAESNYWQIITNVIGGREMRDVDRAISVMEENSQQLARAMETMSEEERETARHYIERMSQMQVLFQFARLIISTLLAQSDNTDFADISNIELQR
jgi:HTH-type transcriptional regulator, glycine betaine synthesis regulator